MGSAGIPLRYGLEFIRVVAAAPPGAVGGMQNPTGIGSVTLHFATSNSVPANVIDRFDIATSVPGSMAAMLGGNPAVVTLNVPQGTRHLWVIGTNTTTPRTRVSVYGC